MSFVIDYINRWPRFLISRFNSQYLLSLVHKLVQSVVFNPGITSDDVGIGAKVSSFLWVIFWTFVVSYCILTVSVLWEVLGPSWHFDDHLWGGWTWLHIKWGVLLNRYELLEFGCCLALLEIMFVYFTI